VKVRLQRESSPAAATAVGEGEAHVTGILAPQVHRATHLFSPRLSFSLCDDASSTFPISGYAFGYDPITSPFIHKTCLPAVC
jgi:hypothetical protein